MRLGTYFLLLTIFVSQMVLSSNIQIIFEKSRSQNQLSNSVKPITHRVVRESIQNLSKLVKLPPHRVLIYTETLANIFSKNVLDVVESLANRAFQKMHNFVAKILDAVTIFPNSSEQNDFRYLGSNTKKGNKISVQILHELINDASIIWNISTNSIINVVDLMAKTQYALKNDAVCFENVQIKVQAIFTDNFIKNFETYFDESAASLDELIGAITAFHNENKLNVSFSQKAAT